MARTAQEAAQLGALLNKKYRYFDYKWDLVFWVTALPVVAAAADITKLLFAGDWDFWTDWKDRQWWMTITPFAMIIIPSALQYIQWLAWKFPTACTYPADVQGVSYLRSATPEYLRMIEHGTLRSFLEETTLVALVFGATLCTFGYWVGQAIARWLAIWPIMRFMKKV